MHAIERSNYTLGPVYVTAPLIAVVQTILESTSTQTFMLKAIHVLYFVYCDLLMN